MTWGELFERGAETETDLETIQASLAAERRQDRPATEGESDG